MMRSTGVTVAVALVLAIASPAAATPLDDARAAISASDYVKARAALTAALARGAYGREELAEIYELRGVVAAALGETAAATDAFQRALALSPKLELAPGTSPRITRPFTAAQQRVKQSGALAIRTEKGTGSVTVIVVADPMSMISKVRAIASPDGKPAQTVERAGAAQTEIALPAGARIEVRIAVVDEYGNRLAELGSVDVPIVVEGTGPAPATPPPVKPVKPGALGTPGNPFKDIVRAPPVASGSTRPIYLKWWVWGGAAVAFGGVATYFGVAALGAKDDMDKINSEPGQHTFDEAQKVADRGRRNALLTNIGFGAAGALAVTGAILYLTEPREPQREKRARIDVHPTPGGAAVVLGGSF